MSGTVNVRLKVNGEEHELQVEPRLLLVHALRDELGLTGTHVGCDTSNCGACTVHLDGKSVKSCTVLAVQADGAEVTTIEGLGSEGNLHPMQEAFWNNHGLQCGYCTPGMIMAAAALLEENPKPSEQEIRHGLEGNLCRCTGYHNIISVGARCLRAVRLRGGVGMSVATAALGGSVGAALRRKEDPPLITGMGRYLDDISVTGMLWMAFVRSPEAHAKIVSIDTSAAAERDGVVAVFTGADMADLGGPLPMAWVPPGVEVNNPEHWPLARDEVNHVGDPVAVVIGEDRYAVSDAVEDVLVEYEPLPVVVDPEQAIAGGPLVHESLGTNKVHEWTLAGGDVEAGFAEADVIVERRVVNHRIAGAPIECRGVIADYRAGSLTLHTSTQVPHFVRLFMALLLGLAEDQVRVIAPDVGGGFGQKLQVYGEELTACWASKRLGRPVKWVETRSENMSVAHQGRDQISHVRMGAKRDGTITAWHVKILADFGAYNMILTPLIPSLGAFVMGGCYKIPNVQTDIVGVFTNKCPTDAIRGAGRPEATQMIEVTLDQLAHELEIDPVEIRRRNFIPKEDFPAATATGVVYDSGDYHGTLDRLMEHIDIAAFREEQQRLRSEGDLPRPRALHLDGDLRPGALAHHRSGRGRRPGRPMGVGDGPGPQHRGGDRLHRHLAARSGPRHRDGADRRRQARRRCGDRRRHSRRYRHRTRGPRHLRLSVAGDRRRGGRQVHRQDRRQGQADRRRGAGGRGRGHRRREREVLGQGLP